MDVVKGIETHGGALDAMRRHFPDAPQPWVDLSTGINPWPWSAADAHLRQLHRLPTEADRASCMAAMAASFGAPRDAIVAAPGSELLIRLLPTVIAPQRVAILAPSYGDHAQAWRAAGCEVAEIVDPLSEAAAADAVVVCNPNNPDGRRFEPAALVDAYRQLARRGGWLIIDEAFADLEPELSLAPMGGSENLLVLRSLGKFYGLAGLRLGALLAPAAVRRTLAQRLGYWSVSAPALAMGTAAYSDRAWQRATRRRLTEAAQRLDRLLERHGCRVVGGTHLFRYVEVANGHETWTRLARRGVYVRRFPWTRRHLRIGLPADRSAAERLAAALAAEGHGRASAAGVTDAM